HLQAKVGRAAPGRQRPIAVEPTPGDQIIDAEVADKQRTQADAGPALQLRRIALVERDSAQRHPNAVHDAPEYRKEPPASGYWRRFAKSLLCVICLFHSILLAIQSHMSR